MHPPPSSFFPPLILVRHFLPPHCMPAKGVASTESTGERVPLFSGLVLSLTDAPQNKDRQLRGGEISPTAYSRVQQGVTMDSPWFIRRLPTPVLGSRKKRSLPIKDKILLLNLKSPVLYASNFAFAFSHFSTLFT